MIIYVIKSSFCLILLWGFYTLFLEREKMHHFKRFYLLFSLIFAYTIPLITITYETDIVITPDEFQQTTAYIPLTNDPQVQEPSVHYLPIVLWGIYGVGFLVFAIRFIRNIYSLIKKVKQNENLKEISHVNVLVNNTIVPYTFLKYIFVPKKEFQQKTIPQEVLLHEKTHVQQKHTLDILCIEIFQVIFWFNPLWFWIKKSVRLNHEFLADQKVLKQQCSIHRYIDLLVSYPNSTNQTVLTSPINYSLTKKRIVMMSQKFSKTRATARMLLLLPILFGCVLLFNNKMVAQQKTKNTTIIEPTHPDKNIQIRVNGEQLSVNAITTDVSGFAKVIDNETKQWKDDEFTGFHLDVKMENTTDAFLKKLNTAYRNTRLYRANPDGHDLVPPIPPLPEAPISAPLPPVKVLKPTKALKVTKKVKAPTPPDAPVLDIDVEVELNEIENKVQLALEEAEKARYKAEIAREESEIVREYEIENAMRYAEEARETAEESRAIAMEAAGNAMNEAQRVRREVMEQAHEARVIAREEVRVKRERSHELREQALRRSERSRLKAEELALHRSKLAMEAAELTRKQAEKDIEKARYDAEKAHKQVRKEANVARKKARKAIEKARKDRDKAEKKEN